MCAVIITFGYGKLIRNLRDEKGISGRIFGRGDGSKVFVNKTIQLSVVIAKRKYWLDFLVVDNLKHDLWLGDPWLKNLANCPDEDKCRVGKTLTDAAGCEEKRMADEIRIKQRIESAKEALPKIREKIAEIKADVLRQVIKELGWDQELGWRRKREIVAMRWLKLMLFSFEFPSRM